MDWWLRENCRRKVSCLCGSGLGVGLFFLTTTSGQSPLLLFSGPLLSQSGIIHLICQNKSALASLPVIVGLVPNTLLNF